MTTEPTEEDYFNDATADDVSESPETNEAPQQHEAEAESEQQTRARDERGRFAAQEQESETEATPAQEQEQPQERETVGMKQLREAYERAERRNEELQRHLMAQQRHQTPQQPSAPQKVEAKPDPLLDPEGYEKYLETRFEERLLNERRESSLQLAARTYGQEFQEAYSAAQQRIDPQLKAMMQESRDPGETLMQWHRDQKVRHEIGGDLNAYKAKLREEALKDPEFRKAAMEAWRTDAGQQRQSNGRPAIDLAPSLNGASRSGVLPKGRGGDDASDYELFHQIAG